MELKIGKPELDKIIFVWLEEAESGAYGKHIHLMARTNLSEQIILNLRPDGKWSAVGNSIFQEHQCSPA